MPSVRRSEAGRSAASAEKLPPRLQGFKAIYKAFSKAESAGKLPKAKLELHQAGLYTGKNGVRAVEVDLSRQDQDALGKYLGFRSVMVDDKRGNFYVHHNIDGNVGPFKLPKGVTLTSLMDDGKAIPKGKGTYEKAVSSLAAEVVKGLPAAYEKGRIQLKFDGGFRAPSGEELSHHYVDDHTGKIPGGALMVGEKEFWVEMIPGVSGEVIGPFPLPKGFKESSLNRPAPKPEPRRHDDFNDDRPSRPVSIPRDSGTWQPSRWTSTSSGSWPSSPGGRPS